MTEMTQEDERQTRRCYVCRRPRTLCYCSLVPSVDNHTEVVVLQHTRERHHPFNTARIVRHALRRCRLVVDHNKGFASRELDLNPATAALLYPGDDAPLIAELSGTHRLEQLVVIDGTWHQAKTVVRDVPALQTLPCFRLQPAVPGQFRIRREPTETSLSTIEATVAALRVLEPDTGGLDALLNVFHVMVDQQLAASDRLGGWRRRPARTQQGIPRVVAEHPERLVVVYGEATPYVDKPGPVNWVAQRLDGSESFVRLIAPDQPLDERVLGHFRLTPESFAQAVTCGQFVADWRNFLRPSDVLVTFHGRTLRLLQNIGAALPRHIVLKSEFGKLEPGFTSPEALLAKLAPQASLPDQVTRALQRLQLAVEFTNVLRDRL